TRPEVGVMATTNANAAPFPYADLAAAHQAKRAGAFAPDQARLFLETIHPAAVGVERYEARYIPPPGQGATVRRFYRTPAELIADAARYAARFNVYVGVATRFGERGTADGTCRAGCAWADVDAKLFGGDLVAARAKIDAFLVPPSVRVLSGGG